MATAPAVGTVREPRQQRVRRLIDAEHLRRWGALLAAFGDRSAGAEPVLFRDRREARRPGLQTRRRSVEAIRAVAAAALQQQHARGLRIAPQEQLFAVRRRVALPGRRGEQRYVALGRPRLLPHGHQRAGGEDGPRDQNPNHHAHRSPT
jgi:hypothetical protein